MFLVSTKAGGIGTNLVGANRVIIFDSSWNPAHDVQSLFRVYRFGQTKTVNVHSFWTKNTIEEKIDKLAKKFNDHIFLFPVHLNPNVRQEVLKTLDSKSNKNVILIDPIKYDEMVFLMLNTCFMIVLKL